ncbi:uncharacterized protein LOC135830562 [Sycon ciliatum]|uniref:uncharacterized protein LOC135830562 n=1 Tax=Sycon ciliatum TaxID=27933 RepID=UPI0031F6A436
MAGNPYKTTEFVSKIHVWLQDVDPVRLRGLVQKEGLISFDQLERLRKMKDIAEHNAELISILCPGETKSYQVLCSVIHQMGYTDRYLEMLRIVDNPVQELLSWVGQPESANAIATRADTSVTMPTEDCTTAAAASAGYAAYQSTPGAASPSPLEQQVAPLCPPMKSRTAAARPGAEGEAAGAAAAATGAMAGAAGAMAGAATAAATAAAAAAAVAMAGGAEADAVASSATVLTPQASLQARLPIGTVTLERVRAATAESELGATAGVSAVPALHHCNYPAQLPTFRLRSTQEVFDRPFKLKGWFTDTVKNSSLGEADHIKLVMASQTNRDREPVEVMATYDDVVAITSERCEWRKRGLPEETSEMVDVCLVWGDGHSRVKLHEVLFVDASLNDEASPTAPMLPDLGSRCTVSVQMMASCHCPTCRGVGR